ncbi:Replication protein O [Paraburkholderia phytofirmans]|nr:Replication protein O [Paraburkholderia phytofirmans]
MSIAQRSVAGEGEAHPCEAEKLTAEGDAQARAEFTCDTTNLPWVIFRAVHRAAQLQGVSARSRALLAALARTVDAKRPYAAIFARRELLTGRAMQSMRTFYRSLDDLEAAGLITRPPQSRYGQAGLFGRAYLHLTESAALLLGLVVKEAPASHTASPDAKAEGAQQARGESLNSRSANVADGAIYKDLFPASQKRQPGTLPEDLKRLTSLGFHEFLVFKLMTEAKANGKFLSDVVDVSWAGLKKAHAPINYLRALLRKPVDFAYRARQLRNQTVLQQREATENAEVTATVARCVGQSFYDAIGTRRITLSVDGSTLTVVDAVEGIPRTVLNGWQSAFAKGIRKGDLQPATEARDATFDGLASNAPTQTAAAKTESAGQPRQLTGGIAGQLDAIKNALRAAGKGKFATVWSGQAQSRPANAAS